MLLGTLISVRVARSIVSVIWPIKFFFARPSPSEDIFVMAARDQVYFFFRVKEMISSGLSTGPNICSPISVAR